MSPSCTKSYTKIVIATAVLAAAAFTSTAKAYDSPAPDSPPPELLSPPATPTVYPIFGTLPIAIQNTVFIRESPTLPKLLAINSTPDTPFVVDSFFDVFLELSVDGGLNWSPNHVPVGTASILYTDLGNGNYATEMLSLDLAGGTLPPGVEIRESPTLQSTGQTTVRANADGTFRINSFFDVFTELSIDGGQNWNTADAPLHLDGTPEPTSLALLAIGATTLLKRRRTF